MKAPLLQHDTLRQAVRQRYGALAEQGGSCGCGPTCCSPESAAPSSSRQPGAVAGGLGYTDADLRAAPEGSNLGLGCGNPQALASLQPGETVLDLGSGAGFDAFLAARAVGPAGRVIGVDMTPEMVSRARRNQASSGLANVEFRLGEIERLPVADASVDLILSNCVINLSPDKGRVFAEAFRVLKPGGRLAVSDIVALTPIPEAWRQEWELHTGCVAGAGTIAELAGLLEQAGFTDIRIVPTEGSREIVREWVPGRGIEDHVASASIQAVKPPGTR